MENDSLAIAQIADAAGVSRRAVRFYVQEKLLAPPDGAGRGSHYTQKHLNQLRRIAELQRAGYALDAIRRVMNGESIPPPPAPPRPAQIAPISSKLITRVELFEGVELSFDTTAFSPNAQGLLALRELAREVFRR